MKSGCGYRLTSCVYSLPKLFTRYMVRPPHRSSRCSGYPLGWEGVQTSRYRRKLSLVNAFNRLTPTNRRHGRVLARVDGAQKLRPTIIACELITTTLVPICRKYGWVVVTVLDCPRSYAQDRPLEVSSISCPVPRQARYGFPTW